MNFGLEGPTVPLIAKYRNWQWAFIITGAIGFIWLIFWFWLYEIPAKQKRLLQPEYDYIHSDKEEIITNEKDNTGNQKISWWQLLQYKQTWAFALGKFLTDPVWWFFLFWLPDFLYKEYHLEGTDVALPVALVYTISSAGSIFGGWLPMKFIKNNMPVFTARRTSMLIYSLFVLPVVFAQYLGSINMWLAVIIIGIATSAHQAWSANIFTTVSDMFPKKTVASVVGIGGMFGALGGILISRLAPELFEHYKALGHVQSGYYIMFIFCGLAYISAWFLMKLIVPGEKRINI